MKSRVRLVFFLKPHYHRQGIDSDVAFKRAVAMYGVSAATTYNWLRQNGEPAWFAAKVARAQMKSLGRHYNGGIECCDFRQLRSTPEEKAS